MKFLLFCQANEPLNREGLARFLAHEGELAGIVVLEDTLKRRWARLRREYRRGGLWATLDVLLFQVWYRLWRLARDRAWERRYLARLCARYAPLKGVPVLRATNPNSPEVKDFVRAAAPDIAIARCKSLLDDEVRELPRLGTFVMHPGVCPEYRNAHGCFWALARRDMKRVGMTLLRADAGVDTGPVYGYFGAAFDERAESHIQIQQRVVFDNLDAIAGRLRAIGESRALPIDTAGRGSSVYGQPRLTRYMWWKWSAFMDRKRASHEGVLMYHDVVPAKAAESSGFSGEGANVYKVEIADFERHLEALKRTFPVGPLCLRPNAPALLASRLMLTFDDGGVSAYTDIAPRLERLGWRGMFFVTTGKIGEPGFLTAEQIRDLYRRGHAIGSHSVSHPSMMSTLSRADLAREWGESLQTLSDIVGARVDIASVPGGYSSRAVESAAAAAGVRFLFTSEPSTRLGARNGMQIIGRYMIKATASPRMVVELAGGSGGTQFNQWIRWNALKLAKRSLGRGYPRVREALLALRAQGPRAV